MENHQEEAAVVGLQQLAKRAPPTSTVALAAADATKRARILLHKKKAPSCVDDDEPAEQQPGGSAAGVGDDDDVSPALLFAHLGTDEIQHILKFQSHSDRLSLVLTCKRWEAIVERWCQSALEDVLRHHHHQLPGSTPTRITGDNNNTNNNQVSSHRRAIQSTMRHPLYHVELPAEDVPLFHACRTLAVSPTSEDQLAIADVPFVSLDSSTDAVERFAFKVVLWDLSRKQVVHTIHHEIAPEEHEQGGNYTLQLLWLPNDLLATCSPASICVWSTVTGQMLHMYRHQRKPTQTVFPRDHYIGDMMQKFVVGQDETTILFVADRNSVYLLDARSDGLVQSVLLLSAAGNTRISTPPPGIDHTMSIMDMRVCDNKYLTILVSKASDGSRGVLVFDLQDYSRLHYLEGNYSSIMNTAAFPRYLLATRVDRVDANSDDTCCFVDVLDLTEKGILSRRKIVPLGSSTTDVLAAFGNRIFVQDMLVSSTKIMVYNFITGERECTLTSNVDISVFPKSAIVAPKRCELMVGLDEVEDGCVVTVFSLLNINDNNGGGGN